jgi:AGCS family alanine or glycine:cation symporter
MKEISVWLLESILIPLQNAASFSVGVVNYWLWGDQTTYGILIFLLVITGIWFSWRLKFIQILDFKHMFSLMRKSNQADESGISSFQALCTSLSARVGTGNLAGVAVAISLGGAGAIFWMWVIALLGMATGYAESVLGQVYTFNKVSKTRRSHGFLHFVYFLVTASYSALFKQILFLMRLTIAIIFRLFTRG